MQFKRLQVPFCRTGSHLYFIAWSPFHIEYSELRPPVVLLYMFNIYMLHILFELALSYK